MNRNDDRPENTRGTKEVKGNDRRGKHPSDGLAGKIQATQTAAPDDATWRDVLKVAWRAFEDDLDPADVWASRQHGDVRSWGGD